MLAITLRQEILFCPLEALDVTSNYLLEGFETAYNFLIHYHRHDSYIKNLSCESKKIAQRWYRIQVKSKFFDML